MQFQHDEDVPLCVWAVAASPPFGVIIVLPILDQKVTYVKPIIAAYSPTIN